MAKKSRISPKEPSVSSSFSDTSSSSVSSDGQQSNHFKLYFENLTYAVKHRSFVTAKVSEKVVFSDLTGAMVSSSLVGIMGPSGAGKSTFIECLASRRVRGRSGSISLKFDNSERRRAKISFIPQKDALQESLTVRECILFASKLQNSARKHTDKNYLDSVVATTVATALAPTDGSKSAATIRRMTISSDGFHEAVAEQMIKLLALGNCADTIVKNISGGQQKRLSIAQELCSKPNILILDEPTSGLDSSACWSLVQVLYDLVTSDPPMLIMCTIHQPPAKVFASFHKIIMLSSRGSIIFDGFPEHTAPVLSSVGLACPSFYNPADYLVEVAAGDYGSTVIDQLAQQAKEAAVGLIDFLENKQKRQGDSAFSDIDNEPNDPEEGNKAIQVSQSNEANQVNEASETAPPEVKANQSNVLHSHTNGRINGIINEATPQALTQLDNSNSVMIDLNSNSIAPVNEKPKIAPLANSKEAYSIDRVKKNKFSTNVNNLRFPKRIHFSILFHRSFLIILRDPLLMSMRFVTHIVIGIFVGFLYGTKIGQVSGCPPELNGLSLDPSAFSTLKQNVTDDIKNVMDNISNLFFNTMVIFFGSLMPTVLTFPSEVSILTKEVQNGWHGMGIYYLAKTLSDLPFQIIFPSMYLAITYTMNHEPADWMRFSLCLLILVLTGLIGQSFGLIVAAFFANDPFSAVFVAPVSILPLFLFSGFLVKVENMPAVFRFLSKFSCMRYSMEGTLIAIYGFNRCTNDATQITFTKHIFTSWITSLLSPPDVDYEDWSGGNSSLSGLNETTRTVDTTAEQEQIKSLSSALLDSLFSGLGGQTALNEDGTVVSGVLSIFNIDDEKIILCVAALVVNLIFLRIVAWLVITWKVRSNINGN